MQTYIVRVYRASPGATGLVSGIVEDIESGQKQAFQNLHELQAMLGRSIAQGQLGFPDFTTQEPDTHDKLVAIG